jgi:hypothetical protein
VRRIRKDAFPFAVAGLLLEKTREVHDLAGLSSVNPSTMAINSWAAELMLKD